MSDKQITPKVNLRAVPVQSTVLGCIEGAYDELSNLQQECQEIVDNAPEGISETQRIQTLGEAADYLDGADDHPDIPECVQDLVVYYTEDRRKSRSTSRQTRCNDAIGLLQGAVGEMGSWLDDNRGHDDADDVQQAIDEIEEMINNAESCEFPGMMG